MLHHRLMGAKVSAKCVACGGKNRGHRVHMDTMPPSGTFWRCSGVSTEPLPTEPVDTPFPEHKEPEPVVPMPHPMPPDPRPLVR